MRALQVYCTSWRPYDSDLAEHYYCRVSEHSAEELEEVCRGCGHLPTGKELRYQPTKEMALSIAIKDNYRGGADRVHADVAYFLENGVTRFFSLHHICEEVHKRYPDAVLYGFYQGTHKEFCVEYRSEGETQDYVTLKY